MRASAVCVFVLSQSFLAQRKSSYMDLFKEKVGAGWVQGGENGELASFPLILLCGPIADVGCSGGGEAGLVMEGEGKKNSFSTRRHVLLPVFVSTYYVLPACSWGWRGDYEKNETSTRRIHLSKVHKQSDIWLQQ